MYDCALNTVVSALFLFAMVGRLYTRQSPEYRFRLVAFHWLFHFVSMKQRYGTMMGTRIAGNRRVTDWRMKAQGSVCCVDVSLCLLVLQWAGCIPMRTESTVYYHALTLSAARVLSRPEWAGQLSVTGKK